ncbi:hypothetical protein ACKWTF_014196 [Chironomus riparius]
MILFLKRRRESEKRLAAERAAKASQSQVPISTRPTNFEKFQQRTSRSLSPSTASSKTTQKSRTLPQAGSSSKASGSTENLRTSSLKIPKSNEAGRRKSSGNVDENSAENDNNSNAPDIAERSKPVCTNTDDHLWSSFEQLDRNFTFIPSVGRAKVTYSYEPLQAIGSPESPDIPDSNQSLSYLLTSCVSNNQRSSVSSLSPVSEPIFQFPTAPKISIEDFGNLPSYDDVMASVDYEDREP